MIPHKPSKNFNSNNTPPTPNPTGNSAVHSVRMSNVRYTPPTEIRSAVWLMLNVLSLAVISLRDRFGIAPCTPLLPRHVLNSLSSFLAQAEPALRRCLYLSAAELGALPAPDRSGASPATKSAQGNAPRNARSLATPVFRLFETGSGRKDASPPPKTFRTGPRIRFLDVDDTPDIHEYDAQSDDILPARALVRRLAAMDHALDHRDVYIRKLRRALGAARALLKPIGKRLYRRGPLTFLQCQTARALEAEALAIQPNFNSS